MQQTKCLFINLSSHLVQLEENHLDLQHRGQHLLVTTDLSFAFDTIMDIAKNVLESKTDVVAVTAMHHTKGKKRSKDNQQKTCLLAHDRRINYLL